MSKSLGIAVSSRIPEFGKGLALEADSLEILPDPTLRQKLSWVDVKKKVPKFEKQKEFVDPVNVDRLLVVRDKKEFGLLSEEIWPPRTKTDLSLRRTRLLDWVVVMRDQNRHEELERCLKHTNVGWDLIFVTNLLCAVAIFGNEWYERIVYLGALEGDLEHYIAVVKKVSDLIKTTGLDDKNWLWYIENAVLSGYRNYPFPGFDILKEAKELAAGGVEHNYFGMHWDALCNEFLPMKYHPVVYVPFEEWVKKASWLTSGASSVGYVMIETNDGKKIKVKARKNMVADVVDLGVLAQDSLAYEGQENFVIIKSELGKLRLAVAGDIYNYLKMTWVTELLGGANYDWPGNTSEETFPEQTKRLAKMLELCSSKFGLPYDYKGFDHQPTSKEILGIVNVLTRHARLNVPDERLTEYDSIVASINHGFLVATLGVKVDGMNDKLPVTGGLMSGLRWTSIVGNGWNSVITGLVLKLLVSWGLDTKDIERFIRGDDSAVFVPNWATGAAVNLGYEAVGAVGGEGKFSLQNHQMEFLRVWFDTRCHGYPMRALPGLTQRKPWSSNPWSEDMVIRAIYETVRTLKRRTGFVTVLDKCWRSLRRIWCRNHNLPDAVCWTPVFAGGYGIEPPKLGELWRIEPAVPKSRLEGELSITNQNNWRRDGVRQYALERYNMDIGDRADEIAREELLSTISSDSVPEVSRIQRTAWLAEVRRLKCRAVKTKVDLKAAKCPVDVTVYQPKDIDELLTRLKAEAPLFGKCPEVEIARSDYDKFRPGIGFIDWIRSQFPRVWPYIGRFHKSWHMSEILDYLSGRIKICPTILHPALTGILSGMVAAILKPAKRSIRGSSVWLGTVLEPELLLAPISQLTYMW